MSSQPGLRNIGIGSTVWIFDSNRRVYPPKKPDGTHSYGGPIFREHFRPVVIKGETSGTWLLEQHIAINKKTLMSAKDYYGHRTAACTKEQMEDRIYIHDTAPRLARRVQECKDVGLLRRIDALFQDQK